MPVLPLPLHRYYRSLGGAAVLAALTAAPLPAQAGAPSQLATGWVEESWTIADGLPVNSINGLLQSQTGYLWAATFDGLVRFDGVRFTVYSGRYWYSTLWVRRSGRWLLLVEQEVRLGPIDAPVTR